MAKQRVALYGKHGHADVDPDATPGAQLGVNFTFNGIVVRPEDIFNQPTPAPEQFPITAWSRILEIPPNVVALAETATTGIYVITAIGTSATREIEGVAGRTVVDNGTGVGGNPVVDLAEVTQTPGGTLQTTTIDAYGRTIESGAADTDDLPEGATNLYFTAQRVRDTLLTGLSFASSAVIAATDSVLSAFGQLQAQITDLVTSLAGYVTIGTTQTITGAKTFTGLHRITGQTLFFIRGGTDARAVFERSDGSLSGLLVNDYATGRFLMSPYDAGGTPLGVLAWGTGGLIYDGNGVWHSGNFDPASKEDAFAKGDLIQGANVTLTGTLTGRLVGSGNVTIAATAGGGGTVDTITAADATVVIDATDPANPTARFTHIPNNTILGRNDVGAGIVEVLTPAEVSTMLGLATTYQPLDGDLTAIAGANPIANQGVYWTGANAVSTYSLTAGGRALGGVAGTANTAPYFSAANTVSLQAVSASGRNLWNIGGTSGGMAYLSAADTWSLMMTSTYGRGLLNAPSLLGVVGDAPLHYALKGTGFGSDPAFGTLDTSDISDIASGTYTPTITNVTNVAASTSNGAQYMRVGSSVTVSGSVDIDPTATGTTTIRISLPVASNFVNNHDCAGVISSTSGEVGPVFANVANDNAQVQFAATNTANHTFYYHFTYRII